MDNSKSRVLIKIEKSPGNAADNVDAVMPI